MALLPLVAAGLGKRLAPLGFAASRAQLAATGSLGPQSFISTSSEAQAPPAPAKKVAAGCAGNDQSKVADALFWAVLVKSE